MQATLADRTGRRTRARVRNGGNAVHEMIDWRATSLADIRDIRLTSFAEASGTLVVAEGEADIPFPIARVFTISGMAPGPVRGSHTLLSCQQVLVCLGGICDVLCDDGGEARTVRLEAPNHALYLPPGIWRELTAAVEQTVVMVLCDRPYDPDDYIGEIETFRRRKAG